MHLFPMNLLRLICSLQNSTSFLAPTAELPSHRFLGSPPRPDEPVCVNPFTIYYSGFRFICQALRQTFLRNFRLFFFFHRFSTAVLGRLHGFFVGFWRFLQRQFRRLPQRSGAGRHSGNAADGSGACVLPLLPEPFSTLHRLWKTPVFCPFLLSTVSAGFHVEILWNS